MVILKDETQLLIPESGPLAWADLCDVRPFECDLTACGCVQQTDHVEQSALSAAARPYDGQKFAASYIEIDVIKGHNVHSALVDLHQFPDCDYIVVFDFDFFSIAVYVAHS
ncbi:Uncharacterised protein [uncultured archaeon]|nr:Uncharacterised protein [uncultured archaeon]